MGEEEDLVKYIKEKEFFLFFFLDIQLECKVLLADRAVHWVRQMLMKDQVSL